MKMYHSQENSLFFLILVKFDFYKWLCRLAATDLLILKIWSAKQIRNFVLFPAPLFFGQAVQLIIKIPHVNILILDWEHS